MLGRRAGNVGRVAAVDDPDAGFERVRFYFDLDRYAEAEQAARDLLGQDPQHPGALYVLAFCALRAKRSDEAEQVSRALLGADPDSPPAHEMRGHVLHARGDPGGAETSFAEALRLGHERAIYYAVLGSFLGRRGRLEEAITVARKGLQQEPEHPVCLRVLQQLYRLNDEPELAERYQREALARDPDHPQAHLEAGLLLLERGEGDAARGRFLESLRLDPAAGDTKAAIAHERVRTHWLFKRGIYLPFDPPHVVGALLTPLVWYGLSLLLWPLVYLAWASAVAVLALYLYHGMFRLCRWHVRRRIERGRV